MKKAPCVRLCLFLACCVLCPGVRDALAGGGTAEADRWEAEYMAYGRRISVSADISVPETDTIPLLAVEPMDELPAADAARFRDFFDRLNRDDGISFQNRANRTYIFYSDFRHHPDLSDAEKVTTPARPLPVYDRDRAYAENNGLTLDEAEKLVCRNIQVVFPFVSFRIRDIVVNDRTRYRKTGEMLTAKGYYELACMQVIDGIPVAGSVHEAYRYSLSRRDIMTRRFGTASALVTDPYNFEGYYDLWDRTAVLGTPVRLLSFDDVRPAIERRIAGGNVRHVYHVYLGYAQYDLPEGDPYEYILVPAWVVWVGWMDDPYEGAEAEAEGNETDYSMGCDDYLPIIVNAVTGEATDPLDTGDRRMLLPETWTQWVNCE